MPTIVLKVKQYFGSPLFLRRVNGWLTIFWVVMVPVSIEAGWINSVAYVSALSLWALVSGHWSAWQAARVEVKQAKEHEEREKEDIPGETVERMVRETEVDREKTQVTRTQDSPRGDERDGEGGGPT